MENLREIAKKHGLNILEEETLSSLQKDLEISTAALENWLRELQKFSKLIEQYKQALEITKAYAEHVTKLSEAIEEAQTSGTEYDARQIRALQKEIFLIVNGGARQWGHESISYEQIVGFVACLQSLHASDSRVYTVQYSHGPKENPQGTLVKGQSVKVKGGMVFDAVLTNSA